jgi:hypothetical protein
MRLGFGLGLPRVERAYILADDGQSVVVKLGGAQGEVGNHLKRAGYCTRSPCRRKHAGQKRFAGDDLWPDSVARFAATAPQRSANHSVSAHPHGQQDSTPLSRCRHQLPCPAAAHWIGRARHRFGPFNDLSPVGQCKFPGT